MMETLGAAHSVASAALPTPAWGGGGYNGISIALTSLIHMPCIVPNPKTTHKGGKVLEFTHFLPQLADHPIRVVEINSERRGSRYRSAGLTSLRITRPTPRRNEKKRSIPTLFSCILQDTQFVTRECRAGNSKHALLCGTVVGLTDYRISGNGRHDDRLLRRVLTRSPGPARTTGRTASSPRRERARRRTTATPPSARSTRR